MYPLLRRNKELEESRKVCVELQSRLCELELLYHTTVNDRDTNFPQVMAMCEEMIGVREELASIKKEGHGRPDYIDYPRAALTFVHEQLSKVMGDWE